MDGLELLDLHMDPSVKKWHEQANELH